jgi:hypothetical protein
MNTGADEGASRKLASDISHHSIYWSLSVGYLLLYRAKSHVNEKKTVAKTRKNVAERGKPRG